MAEAEKKAEQLPRFSAKLKNGLPLSPWKGLT
jgi:hypothetical protein